MVQKRQLAEEEYDVSSKHLKLDNSCQLVSCLEFPSKDVPYKPCSSAEGGDFPIEIPENNRQFESGMITDKPTRLVLTDDTYSCLLRFPPLKEVPVGPEYQARIPECCGYDTNNDENKFLGSCVIPMPESSSTVSTDFAVEKGRNDCFCEDRGSLRCVRQHIPEARENLRVNIGRERFSALGFDSMGDVACKWTEEEEQLFHEIVYSNPVSLGKNFWEKLEETFPSRTNQEIVSYYFNVFVLQRRAEQNRFDPMNADSDDDDELQVTDSSEEDNDSRLDEIQKYGFGIKKPVFDHDDDAGFIFDDSKVWDVDYFSFPRGKADFLPTGSMIEEVFGVESWDIEVTDNE